MANRFHLTVLLTALVACSCASPLSRLSNAVEAAPRQWWGYSPPETDTLQDLQQRLRTAAWYLRIDIRQERPANGAYGTFNPLFRVISIDPALAFDAQVQVVAHELCHALQPIGLETLSDTETFADACAYLVVLPDRDDLQTFARYLGRFRTTAPAVIRSYRREIQWAAAVLRLELPREE